jgi:hypothetical protein
MASADFWQPVPTPLDAGSTRQTARSPRVIRVTFLPYTRRIYCLTLPDDYWALKIVAFSPGWDSLICGFCSSGRDFACGFLRIPPRGRHPCRSASGSRHQGPQGTCTPKSLIDHHSLSSGAYAPRAMPGAPYKIAACSLQFAVCSLQLAVCSLQFAVCSLPFAVCRLPFTDH